MPTPNQTTGPRTPAEAYTQLTLLLTSAMAMATEVISNMTTTSDPPSEDLETASKAIQDLLNTMKAICTPHDGQCVATDHSTKLMSMQLRRLLPEPNPWIMLRFTLKETVEHDDTLRLLEHASNPMEVSPGNSVEIKPRELLQIQKILYTICER